MRAYDDYLPAFSEPESAPLSPVADSYHMSDQSDSRPVADTGVVADTYYMPDERLSPAPQTGLFLRPGQSYTPGAGRAFNAYAQSYGQAFGGNGYPGRSQSLVSYVGPTVSARPAFNVRWRGMKVRDLFRR